MSIVSFGEEKEVDTPYAGPKIVREVYVDDKCIGEIYSYDYCDTTDSANWVLSDFLELNVPRGIEFCGNLADCKNFIRENLRDKSQLLTC